MARRLEERMAEVHACEPSSPLIPKALASSDGPLVAVAARRVKEAQLHPLIGPVRTALAAWLVDGNPRKDPGCRAQLALVEALDALDEIDTALFERAARRVQMEPVWGGHEDAAGPLRARAAAALVHRRSPELLLILTEHLVDPVTVVRTEAVDSLACTGDPAIVPVLALKLLQGDPEGEVWAAAAGQLLRLAPGWAVPKVTHALDGPMAIEAVLALGQSRLSEAVEVIATWIEDNPGRRERQAGLTALGNHRSVEARDVLLGWLRDGSEAEAEDAWEALGWFGQDPAHVALMREARRSR